MNAPAPIVIEAHVDPAEHAGLIAAAEQLSGCLTAASGTPSWSVQLQFYPLNFEIVATPPPSAIIVSLLPETSRLAEPIVVTEARWRAYLGQLNAIGTPVFVRTVFRHVRDRTTDRLVSQLLERIRRLNRMAAGLSSEFGVAVVDVDRAFADIGGRALDTDYRLSGVLAAEVSGHTTVWSLLSFGLDQAVDPALQEKAKALLGGLRRIDAVLTRRLAYRAAQASAAKVKARCD